MKNVRSAFEVWEKDISELTPGYQNITCRMIFDVNMGKKFRRKARFFADRNKTNTPAATNYLSVVSMESVWISLAIVELNNLNVLAYNIQNAYLAADCRERVWVVDRPEFVSEAGNYMLVRKALYVLKSSGAAFRAFL